MIKWNRVKLYLTVMKGVTSGSKSYSTINWIVTQELSRMPETVEVVPCQPE